MPVLDSTVDPGSERSRANRAAHTALIDDLRTRLQRSALGGPESARAKHTARGKLLTRDRVSELLDPGSSFLEIAPLAAEEMYDGQAPAAGVVAGIGIVAGRPVLVVEIGRAHV